MCDQTQIEYVDGDIVWVKFRNLWWPGEVCELSRLPPGLTESFRKLPFAVVKFFQEESYEYVRTINEIYRYNCIRKHEFIKKGLDLFRSKNRKNMEKFPEDVAIAERRTDGDPNIIHNEEFQPVTRPNIASIFGDSSPKVKKGKGGRRKASTSPGTELMSYSRTPKRNQTPAAASSATPGRSNYTTYGGTPARSYGTPSAANRTPTSVAGSSGADYKCHHCDFSTNRQNVIIFHNRTHSSEKKPAPVVEPPSVVKPKVTPPARKAPVVTPKVNQRTSRQSHIERFADETDSDEDDEDSNRGIVLGNTAKPTRPGRKPSAATPATSAASKTPPPKKRQPRKSAALSPSPSKAAASAPRALPRAASASTPAVAATAVVVREKLLADWDDASDTDTPVSPRKEMEPAINSGGDARETVAADDTVQQQQQQQHAIRNIPKKDRLKWSSHHLDHGEKVTEQSSSASSEREPIQRYLDSQSSDGQIEVLISTDTSLKAPMVQLSDVEDEPEDDPSAVIVLDSEDSDNELLRHTDDPKAMSDDEHFDRRSNSSDDQVEEVIEETMDKDETVGEEAPPVDAEAIEQQTDDNKMQESRDEDAPETNATQIDDEVIVESLEQQVEIPEEREEVDEAGDKQAEDHRAKEENDLLLLQQSADLLHETTSLLNTAAAVATTTTNTSIEPIGVIGKKRRLQRKHRRTNESESVDESVDDEVKTSIDKTVPVTADAGDADVADTSTRPTTNSHREHAEEIPKIEPGSEDEPAENGNAQEVVDTDEPATVVDEQTIEVEHTSQADEVRPHPPAEKTAENKENETANGIEGNEPSSMIVEDIEEEVVSKTPSQEIESSKDEEITYGNDQIIVEAEQVATTEHSEADTEQNELEQTDGLDETKASACRQSETENASEGAEIAKSESELEPAIEADALQSEIEPTAASVTEEPIESDVIHTEASSNEIVAGDANRDQNEKIETLPISPAKNEDKIDVDCFDFKDEEEEFVPKSLNRRKRRCLPPGKRFELETMDKLEEIRKIEEEKAKRLKSEKEQKEKEKLSKSEPSVENFAGDADEIIVPESATIQHSPLEKNAVDEHLKDGRSLPPKERGKRIFKSRNRSRQSEGDSFSNDEKAAAAQLWDESDTSPTKIVSEPLPVSPTTTVVASATISVPDPVEVENKIEKCERRSTLDAEAIVSEVVDTLINLPMSSDLSGDSTIKIGHKRPSVTDPTDQSSPSKLMKPIKMTFALSGSSDTIRIVKSDDEPSDGRPMDTEVSTPSATNATHVNKGKKSKLNDEGDVDAAPTAKKRKSSHPHTSDEERGNSSDSASKVQQTATPSRRNLTPLDIARHGHEPAASDSPEAVAHNPIKSTIPVALVEPPTMPAEPKKRGGHRKSNATGKVLMKIGYDTQGNPITVLRKPPTSPVVHLPSHIQTPDLAVPPNAPTFTTKGSGNTQIVITSKGTLLTTNTTTNSSQMTSTVSVSNSNKTARSSASVTYSKPIKSPAKIQVHSQKIIRHGETAATRVSPLMTVHGQPGLSQQQMIVDDLQKRGFLIQESTQSQKIQATKPKTAGKSTAIVTSDVAVAAKPAKASRVSKKQQQQQQQQQLQMQQEIARRQQEEAAARQHEAEKAAEITQNIQDNQLLAIPADNFDGPPGAFYLCTAENNTYFPIDRQPLYLDDKNQLVPMPGATGPMNVAMNEDIVDDGTAQASVGGGQEPEYGSSSAAVAVTEATTMVALAQEQITTNLPNLEDPSNLTYLINTGDGQQILLDQQSMLQLTAGGEMPQLITADGQQLILQGSPQDILAAISSSNPHHPAVGMAGAEQIIIPEEMTVIQEEGNANHDILAAALADTEYMGDVLHIQSDNGIDANAVVEPNMLTFQTINQAATSETNAILPPIMSTLEQPSSKTVDGASPSVDCANLDESLAVIGVSAPQTNVPTSLELPITVTNPSISSAAAAPQSSAYELFDASSLAISSETVATVNSPIVSTTIVTNDNNEASAGIATDELHDEEHVELDDATSMDIDSNSEIIPNTPDSVTNQARTPELTGFTSDNSNSCEIPLQSNLILRTPSTPPPQPLQPPQSPLAGDHVHFQNSSGHTTNHTAADDDDDDDDV